jgi:cysteine/O-acetylserine efflux protein
MGFNCTKTMNFLPFLTYVIVTTFTPGPNNVLAMSNAMRDGYKKTLGFLAGIFTGFLLVMLLCGLLNYVLLSLLPQVKLWLNLLGAGYMVYLALHIIFSRPAENGQDQNNLNSFRAGFVLQFLNLKVILYGITVFSTFIIQAYHDPLTVSLFAPILAGVGLISTSFWAGGGHLFRSFFAKIFPLVQPGHGGPVDLHRHCQPLNHFVSPNW